MDITLLIIALAIIAWVAVFLKIRKRQRGNEETKKTWEDAIGGADQLLEVWICPLCGFKSLISQEKCSWCNAPRPGHPLYQTISMKEFGDQVEKPTPKPYKER